MHQQEEESSVHHRESFSSSTSSSRVDGLRKAAAVSSTSSSARAEAMSHSSMSSLHQRSSALATNNGSDSISSSHHSNHLATATAASHFAALNESSAQLTLDGRTSKAHQMLAASRNAASSRSSFLESYDTMAFTSPDARSLAKDIGTHFADLEFALISTQDRPLNAIGYHSNQSNNNNHQHHHSSLSSRLFGGDRKSLLSSLDHNGGSDWRTPIGASRNLASPTNNYDNNSRYNFKSIEHTSSNSNSASGSGSGSRDSDRIQELLNKARDHCERAGVVNRSPFESSPTTTTTTTTITLRGDLNDDNDDSKPLQPLTQGDELGSASNNSNINKNAAIASQQSRCKAAMSESIERIDKRMSDLCKKLIECQDTKEAIELLKIMIQMIEKAWSVPVCGDDLGFKLCNSLRQAGGLDVILGFIHDSDKVNRSKLEAIQQQHHRKESKSNLMITSEQSQNQKSGHQLISAQAKNNSSSNPLRLNLTKINQDQRQSPPTTPPKVTAPTTAGNSGNTEPSSPTATKASQVTATTTKDSDSDILTSDLGLDSTSIESLSYMSPAAETNPAPKTQTNTGSGSPAPGNEDRDTERPETTTTDSETTATTEVAATTGINEESETAATGETGTAESRDETSLKEELVFLSSRLLSQCLTSENREYIVDFGLDPVIRLACSLTLTKSECGSDKHSDLHASVGTEILEHLFKHNEDTCTRIISLGGLSAILYGCRSSHIETLRHCASALANLALYGGPDSQQTMIEQKAHVWLFPLAFNEDDNILQYYACLAIVVLAANQEIEADVLKSSTLNLVAPFVTLHEPRKFAESTTSHIHGQSATWLRKLVPLLESKREEARNLAAFHFAMEAYIKREQGRTQVFKDIKAVAPLRKVGSSPIAIASKFACQALRLIGEPEPHKLSQQVPLWTSEDVATWVGQIGFEKFKRAFEESQVDGDLLLQLDEDMLKTDIGIENGIIRRRFLRELLNLKRIADYSSVDRSDLSSLLTSHSTGTSEFVPYIYPLVQLGVTRDNIHLLDSEQLLAECRIANSIHRMKLALAIKNIQERVALEVANGECHSGGNLTGDQKSLDVFVSYRRSTGSQLASLLKVHLQLRGFSVFIDVERLEAGKFDNNLLDSIRAAKNFILVLSPAALDRCIGDHECKDWVHKEIVAALASNCNIIPIIDNFHWPDAEQLPEDMRSITYFNGIRWIHDYQDACVDKVERFIRGEFSNGLASFGSAGTGGAGNGGGLGSSGAGGAAGSSNASSLQRMGATSASTPSIIGTPSMLSFPATGQANNSASNSHHQGANFNSYRSASQQPDLHHSDSYHNYNHNHNHQHQYQQQQQHHNYQNHPLSLFAAGVSGSHK